jgi:hypothetical protein
VAAGLIADARRRGDRVVPITTGGEHGTTDPDDQQAIVQQVLDGKFRERPDELSSPLHEPGSQCWKVDGFSA